MDISGARTLVTGGSEGIGYGIAKVLAAKGARVAIMGRGQFSVVPEQGDITSRVAVFCLSVVPGRQFVGK